MLQVIQTDISLRWRHNGHKCVSTHQPRHCLLNRLFQRRSKKTSKLRVTGLCAGNSPGTGEFPAQMASNAENVSIWWRHHVIQVRNTIWLMSIAVDKKVSNWDDILLFTSTHLYTISVFCNNHIRTHCLWLVENLWCIISMNSSYHPHRKRPLHSKYI